MQALELIHRSIYPYVLAVTMTIELPLVCLLLYRKSSIRIRGKAVVLLVVAFLATLITHPFFYFVILEIPGISRNSAVFGGEVLVMLVEAAIYAVLLRPKPIYWAFYASILANIASWQVGPSVLSYWLRSAY